MAYMSQEGYDKLVAQLKEMETIEEIQYGGKKTY